jgi:hypothetical protein
MNTEYEKIPIVKYDEDAKAYFVEHPRLAKDLGPFITKDRAERAAEDWQRGQDDQEGVMA